VGNTPEVDPIARTSGIIQVKNLKHSENHRKSEQIMVSRAICGSQQIKLNAQWQKNVKKLMGRSQISQVRLDKSLDPNGIGGRAPVFLVNIWKLVLFQPSGLVTLKIHC
jgi:hypothetical protein